MAKRRSVPAPDLWRQAILKYIAAHPDQPQKVRPLARALDVPSEQAAAFRDLVRSMLDEGDLALGRGRTITLPQHSGALTGVYRTTRHGYGFIESPGKPDTYVPRDAARNALDGDLVQARLIRGERGPEDSRAEITRIVQHAEVRWVGVLARRGKQCFIQPQGRTNAPEILIDDPTAQAARLGDLVVVEPLAHTLGTGAIRGVITERLGDPDETTTKIRGVIRRAGIPVEFPPGVRAEAQAAAAAFTEHPRTGYEDLRTLLTITIDPPDARDFDDAISIEHLPGGLTRLGVHIADVASFVQPDSALDMEARQRGNSVYFPGLVVPMLPEVLSNGVCSLQPQQPRAVKSVFIDYDKDARVAATRLTNAMIRSHARLTYHQVTHVLEGRTEDVDRPAVDLIAAAEKLAKRIQARRRAAGMISLAIPAVEIVLDAQNRPVDSHPADTSFSHTLIEMFMVEANEAVSRALDRASLQHIRRIHPEPDPESAVRYQRILGSLGLPASNTLDREEMLRVLKAIDGRPEAPTVHFLLLRSMAQAMYGTGREGHFALASEHYCHFTSPIRRYADLTVHRQFDQLVEARRARGRAAVHQSDAEPPHDLDAVALHLSQTERRAQDAEREARQILLLDVMRPHVGCTLEATVVGVTALGAFVQVQRFMAEGLVRRTDLGRGDWTFVRELGALLHAPTQRVLRIGHQVSVILDEIDDLRSELLFRPTNLHSWGQASTAVFTELRSRPESTRARRHAGRQSAKSKQTERPERKNSGARKRRGANRGRTR